MKTGDQLVRLEHHGEEITHRILRQDRLREPGVPYPDLKAFEKKLTDGPGLGTDDAGD